MGFRYGVFISYAHHDNSTHGDWIAAFKNRLEADYRSRTGQQLNVFFDQEDMQTGTVLSNRIREAVRESRLFIPILTPAYLASRWCRQEFLYFMEVAGTALVSGYRSRIMPVRLMPWSDFRAASDAGGEVDKILSFLDGREVLYLDCYRDPLPVGVDDPEFQRIIAKLSKEINLIFNDIEGRTSQEETAGNAHDDAVKFRSDKQGRLLYQIPDEMEVLEETRCRVRIAFDEKLLLEGIELSPGTELRDIRVSEVMEVQLIDPAEEAAFAIRTFNRSEQFVEKASYTEWIFFVKPLREGKFPLLLRVTVIEQVGNKERARDIVLEEEVNIVADLDQESVGEPQFRNSDIVLGKEGAPAVSAAAAPAAPKQRKTRSTLSRLATVLSAILVLSVIGVNYLTRMGGEASAPEIFERVDEGIEEVIRPDMPNKYLQDSLDVTTRDTLF